MPIGPKGEKRPADMVGCAIVVAQIATGEIREAVALKSGRVRSGQAGARARAEKSTAKERSEIARRAAAGRWK